jgi:hypothetical protein
VLLKTRQSVNSNDDIRGRQGMYHFREKAGAGKRSGRWAKAAHTPR